MLLHLIRHPLPEITSGVCYGQSDIGLDEPHFQQVSCALRRVLPADIAMYSSPLQRCLRLARALQPCPLPDARLMEMSFGRWEMRSWDDIDRAEIDAWAADVAGYVPGGGESVIDMASRVISFLADPMFIAHSELAVVAHAGSIRLILAYRPGMSPADLAGEVVLANRQISFGERIFIERELC